MTAEPPRFPNEQAEAQHWLGVLKDGPDREKLAARRGLAHIFEKRGMPEEAIELLVTCVLAGNRDPDTYEQLARLYAAQHRSELSVRARAEAHQLRTQAQRDRGAVDARPQTQEASGAAPAVLQSNRRISTFYVAAGGMMAVGGFLFAASQEGGGHLILWGLPVAGVAVFLHGLAGMLAHQSWLNRR